MPIFPIERGHKRRCVVISYKSVFCNSVILFDCLVVSRSVLTLCITKFIDEYRYAFQGQTWQKVCNLGQMQKSN